MPNFRDNLESLKAASVAFARQREYAEAKVAEVNPLIMQFYKAKLLEKGLQVTGPIIECWPHPETDTTTFNAVAIQVPDGIGVVRFDLSFGDEPNEETIRYFVAFQKCEPSLHAKLYPHIDKLITELIGALDIANTKQ